MPRNSGRPARVTQDETELVARAAEGDKAAFSELVRRHQDEVFTLAVRLTADRELGADVSQEAFVRAWKALPRFRGDARFSTWLYRITANTAYTHRTRAAKQRTESLDTLGAEPRSVVPDPEASAEAADLRGRLAEAIDVLPVSQRTVVVLKDIYGWTHREIAEHVGISIAAAKVRLHRGRSRLRDELWSETK